MIVTLTGVSGAGKTTIANHLLTGLPKAKRVVSYTTRKSRETDPSGEYAHLSHNDFMKMDMSGRFLWTVQVHGDTYGTAVKSVDEALSDGGTVYVMVLVSVRIDILRSYAQATAKGNKIKSFYVLSPRPEVLRERLEKRGDDKESIESRLADCVEWDSTARNSTIPYVFVKNDKDIETVVDEITSLLSFGDCCF